MQEIERSCDRWFNGALELYQPRRGHRAGTDSVLLSCALGKMLAPLHGVMVDVGAGVGTVGLSYAWRNRALAVDLLENHALMAQFARDNVTHNGLENRATVREADLFDRNSLATAGLEFGKADYVVTNPPFYDQTLVQPSPHRTKSQAHTLPAELLSQWIIAALALLRPGGYFAMIHLAQSLPMILKAIDRRLGAITLLPIVPKTDLPATRLVIVGRKNSRAPLTLLPPLALHSDQGTFNQSIAEMAKGKTVLSMDHFLPPTNN